MKSIFFAAFVLVTPCWILAEMRVVATTPDLASVAQEVGGSHVRVESLAVGIQNPHYVEAKPSLIVKLMKADLFIKTGLELEIGWAPLVVQGSRNPKIQLGASGHLDASLAVEPMDVPVNPTRAMGDVHPGGNPHYMMDPENARLVARLISKKMSELDPDKTQDYEKNLAAFEAKLDAKLKEWQNLMIPYKGAKYVGYHKDMSYFAKRFGLEAAGEIEPKPGIPPTASHTASLIQLMKAQKVPLVLSQVWYERRTPEYIAKQTGARLVFTALQPGSFPDAKDYLTAIEHNVTAVVHALGGGQ